MLPVLLALLLPLGKPAPRPATPNVLVVTLGSVRADAIGAQTPVLQSCASRGVSFRAARATDNPPCSTFSLLSGDHHHAIEQPVDDAALSLPAQLEPFGYRTFAPHDPLFADGVPRGMRNSSSRSRPVVNSLTTGGTPYGRVHLLGLSGGGRTATLYAALDPRITTTVSVAGSLPLYLRTGESIGDIEQTLPELYAVAGQLDLYMLNADTPARARAGGAAGHRRRTVHAAVRPGDAASHDLARHDRAAHPPRTALKSAGRPRLHRQPPGRRRSASAALLRRLPASAASSV